MNVLYLTGTAPAGDQSTIGQLTQVAPQIRVTTVASANEALQAIRGTGNFHTLITSPSLAHNETLALITSLRRDRVPIAIVPVVAESHQDFFASAVSSGADDVLMMRGDTINRVTETMTRIRQSPYLFPAEDRRHLRVFYAGRDQVVWALLEQIPFVKAERATCASDGSCPVRNPGADDGGLRCDVVVVDEHPGDAHPLQVIKSVKAQASDLPVVVLTSSTGAEVAIAALDLGADDTVTKTGIYRRRLIATLRRVHQRIEMAAQHEEVRAREGRLRQIVETVPHGIAVISGDGTVLAMNATALAVVGATRPKDAVGRNVRSFVVPSFRDEIGQMIRRVSGGDAATIDFDVEAIDSQPRKARLRGVPLERDARGRRAVIATLQIPGPDGADAADAHQVQSELHQVRTALRETGHRHADLEKQLATERNGWTAMRRQIEERAAIDRETAAHGRAEMETALLASHAELSQVQAARVAERAEWDAARDDFQARLHEVQQGAERERLAHEAGTRDLQARINELEAAAAERADAERGHEASRAELQTAIDDARRELHQAVEIYSAERASWTTAREHLERELGQIHEARRADEQRWTGERAAFEAARADLQRRLDAAARDRSALDETRRELQHAVDTYGAERASWAAARENLEHELGQTREARRDDEQRWAGERSAFEAARADLQQSLDSAARDRSGWDETRRALEARVTDLQAFEKRVDELRAQAADRDALNAALEITREDLQQATGRLAAGQSAWDETRATLEHRLQELQARVGDLQEIEAALESTRSELDRTAGAQELERSVWQADRRGLEERIASAQGAFDEQRRLWDATREVLDQEVALYCAREEQERGEMDRLRQSQLAHDRQLQEASDRFDQLADAAVREQTRLAEELSRSAVRLDRLQNSDLFGYTLMTIDGHLIRCNDVFARMLGYVDAEDALVHTNGEPLAAMVGRDEIDARLASSGRTSAVEACLTRTDGLIVRVIESAVVVAGTPGEEAVVERILIDIGNQATLEEQLRQARRLGEVGHVAAAMAPDIEELLQSIGEGANRLSAELDQTHPHRSEADAIVARATRAGELLRQLLAFSRKQGRAPEPVDLNDVVTRAEPTLARLIGVHIDFRIHLGQAEVVAAAEDDLEQLLTTLVVSARDLLPIGGTLRVETGVDVLRLTDASNDEAGSGAHQILAVVAAGYGLQAALPTAAIELVARRCGGELSISGEPGRRAVLHVRFPRCSASPASNW